MISLRFVMFGSLSLSLMFILISISSIETMSELTSKIDHILTGLLKFLGVILKWISLAILCLSGLLTFWFIVIDDELSNIAITIGILSPFAAQPVLMIFL